MYVEAEVQALKAEFDIAIEDVQADMPDVEAGFEVDLADGVCGMSSASQESIIEFCRREFGYAPHWLRARGVDFDTLDI